MGEKDEDMMASEKKDEISAVIEKAEKAKAKKEEKKEEELSEEDKFLKESLELAVTRIIEPNAEDATTTGVQAMAIEILRREIRTSTSSMTAVPKPLKFLRDSYASLQTHYKESLCKGISEAAIANKKDMADILSVLAMTMAVDGTRQSLHFKLEGNREQLGEWGHEFVRSLAGDIGEEFSERTLKAGEDEADTADLLALVDTIVPFHIIHNSEPEAVDLLIEVSKLGTLREAPTIDDTNYSRICEYLLRCADYAPDLEDLAEMLDVAFCLYKKNKQFPDALRVILKLDEGTDRVKQLFDECEDPLVLKQMGIILASANVNFEVEDDEDLNEMIGNMTLSEVFLNLGKELDVMDAKTPEDIYKSHLSNTGSTARRRENVTIDSAKKNLASTFVNAFVNAGFNTDKLMTTEDSWVFKNKDQGMMCAAASLGMIMLWNVDEGLATLDKFLTNDNENVKAGAILAIGIVNNRIRHAVDPAFALLQEEAENPKNKKTMRCAVNAGFGLAFAGSQREDVQEFLTSVIENKGDKLEDMEEIALSSLSLGLVYVGSCNDEVTMIILQRLMESKPVELNTYHARLMCLGLGLLYLGKQDKVDVIVEAVKTIEHKISDFAQIVLETCAYAATGNVLQVQKLLHKCAEHVTTKEEGDAEAATTESIEPIVHDAEAEKMECMTQSAAVLGIGLVAMGEPVGSEMVQRSMQHLLQYGESPIRRTIPLAMALLNVSKPDYAIVDSISRLSHDPDAETSINAILSLGIISAGTNNSRVAGMLRQLSEFYHREAQHLFVVRIAQGLLHMAKGLITLHPFHSDRLLLSKPALGGLLIVMQACFEPKATILDKAQYLLFFLTCAMRPRMLVTVDEEMNPLPVSVRVGQAVETVGQAGKPKRITGFQTHTTPVLLGVEERAELASDEYLSISSVLEGVVILRKNPDSEAVKEALAKEKLAAKKAARK